MHSRRTRATSHGGVLRRGRTPIAPVRRSPTIAASARGIALSALAALAPAPGVAASTVLSPVSLGAQELPAGEPAGAPRTEADSVDAVLSTADSIRAAMAGERPPDRHPAVLADIVSAPFELIALPLHFVLVHVPSALIGELAAPRPPGGLVRALRDLQAAGVHPGVRASIGPRSGPAATLRLAPAGPVGLESGFSIRGSQGHRLVVAPGDDPRNLGASIGWRRDAQVAFYGRGAHSPDRRTLYGHETFDVTAAAGMRLGPALRVRGDAGYEDNLVREPVWAGDEPSMFDELDTEELFGARERLRYVRMGARVELSLLRRVGFQDRGVRLAAGATRYEPTRSGDGFHKLRFAARGGLPLNPRQMLALRGSTELTRGAVESVPFYHLAALGGWDTAPGYPDTRFRDLDMISLAAEWRYEVWRDIHNSIRLESFLHFGEGAVGARLGDVTAEDWRASYAFGLRLARVEQLLGLVYFGFSEESFHFGVSGELSP